MTRNILDKITNPNVSLVDVRVIHSVIQVLIIPARTSNFASEMICNVDIVICWYGENPQQTH